MIIMRGQEMSWVWYILAVLIGAVMILALYKYMAPFG